VVARTPPVTVTSAAVKAQAAELGFIACGVTDLAPSAFGDALDRWLADGLAGTMRYLHRQAAKRKEPARIVPGAVRAIIVLENYVEQGDGERTGIRIAKYARGRDYHLEVGRRLERLCDSLREAGATIARAFVDAGPVPERELARRAGLGWIGKNTMLIRPNVGSFFLIGAVLTDLELELDPPFETDHCGTCTRCLDACPTGALIEPRLLDATRCISYQTIEQKGPIPEAIVDHLQGWAFGCDICNDVCPWNERFAGGPSPAAYHDRGAVPLDDPLGFERMTAETFDRLFADTPLERPGLAGMRRNWTAAFASRRDPAADRPSFQPDHHS
jgi:epoxyqueuosine reductase